MQRRAFPLPPVRPGVRLLGLAILAVPQAIVDPSARLTDPAFPVW